MLPKSVPARPPSLSLARRHPLLTLLGPIPNLKAILIAARIGPTPDIERHRRQLLGYREKVMALLNLLEGSPTISEDETLTSEQKSSFVPTAA